jgi:hypothetical protein
VPRRPAGRGSTCRKRSARPIPLAALIQIRENVRIYDQGPSPRVARMHVPVTIFLGNYTMSQTAIVELRPAGAMPERNWKISESDYAERELWDDYIAAFEVAISSTTTHEAPWYVIPSNHKWFRNLAVSQIMADKMEELGMAFPKPTVDLAEIRRKYHKAEREERDG